MKRPKCIKEPYAKGDKLKLFIQGCSYSAAAIEATS